MEKVKFGILDALDTKGMTQDDLEKWNALDEAVGEAFHKAMDSYLKDEMKLEDFHKSVQKSVKELNEKCDGLVSEEKFAKKMAEIEKFAATIKAATERTNGGGYRIKSLEEQIFEQMGKYAYKDSKGMMKLKSEEFKSDRANVTVTLVLEKKASTDPVMTTGGSPVAGGVTIDPNIAVAPRKRYVIRDLANVSSISTTSVTYAEMTNVEGEAGWVSEGNLKPSMSADLKTTTVNVGKVALSAKITTEVMQDIPQLVQEIRSEIINKIDAAEEDGILNGTGSDGEIKGVSGDFPAFTLDGIEVQAPNYYDALVAAYTQITSTSNMAYAPNGVRMNPVDYANMQLTKDVNGQYLRPFKVGDELVSGLRVIADPNQAVGSFIMGDWRYLNIRDYQPLTVSFGWENQDFTKNMVTMIGEKRLLAYIKSNYKTAFVSDTFDDVITAITPSA